MKTVIIGGGIAGLTAAWHLAKSGHRDVIVLESEEYLGGKAGGWRDADGDVIEAGLHICFAHYTHLLSLMRELEVEDKVAWQPAAFTYAFEDGSTFELKMPPLPPPLPGVAVMLRYPGLRMRDRVASIRAAAEAATVPWRWLETQDSISFKAWLRKRLVPEAVVTQLFEPMTRGLTFINPEDVSATTMLRYVRQVARSRQDFGIGFFQGGVFEALIEPLVQRLRALGVEVRVNQTVQQIELGEEAVTGVLMSDGERIPTEAVICATPAHVLPTLISAADLSRFRLLWSLRLSSVPVISAQVWLDRRVDTSPGLWFFPGAMFNSGADVTRYDHPDDQHAPSVFHLVIAPAAEYIERTTAELESLVTGELRARVRSTWGAKVRKVSIVRMYRSIHFSEPGSERLRPACETRARGLFLAGDYVKTGHSCNLEGAVSSALAAARAVMAT
ncbi:MAG: FAD-dependent oxidoreductase [Bradymonadia bacterium]